MQLVLNLVNTYCQLYKKKQYGYTVYCGINKLLKAPEIF